MRRVISAAAALALGLSLAGFAPASAEGNTAVTGEIGLSAVGTRAFARSAGADRLTAIAIAQKLLAQPNAMQLTRVRCERYRTQHFCGLILSGVKFHRTLDTASFERNVSALVGGAFAVDPAIAEVDLWVTVPLDAGKGAVVSGDFAMPTAATVYATTVVRGAQPGKNVFWDPAFAQQLARGSRG